MSILRFNLLASRNIPLELVASPQQGEYISWMMVFSGISRFEYFVLRKIFTLVIKKFTLSCLTCTSLKLFF